MLRITTRCAAYNRRMEKLNLPSTQGENQPTNQPLTQNQQKPTKNPQTPQTKPQQGHSAHHIFNSFIFNVSTSASLLQLITGKAPGY